MDDECIVQVKNVAKDFTGTPVFEGLSLEVYRHEIVALLGPSGCGKSTLLRMIADLESVEQGTIEHAKCEGQSVGYVFQKPILYPHMDVGGNVSLGFGQKVAKKQRQKIIDEELKLVGLEGFSSRKTETLSGGEAQRVTVVRALLNQPQLLLLDEPFSALDLSTRRQIASDTRSILKSKKTSAIHVTHDPEEAKIIADRVLRWSEITQIRDD